MFIVRKLIQNSRFTLGFSLAGIELHQFFPIYGAVVKAKGLGKLQDEFVFHFGVRLDKFLISLLCGMAKRLNNVGVKCFLAGNECPKTLAAILAVIPHVIFFAPAITTSVDRVNA